MAPVFEILSPGLPQRTQIPLLHSRPRSRKLTLSGTPLARHKQPAAAAPSPLEPCSRATQCARPDAPGRHRNHSRGVGHASLHPGQPASALAPSGTPVVRRKQPSTAGRSLLQPWARGIHLARSDAPAGHALPQPQRPTSELLLSGIPVAYRPHRSARHSSDQLARRPTSWQRACPLAMRGRASPGPTETGHGSEEYWRGLVLGYPPGEGWWDRKCFAGAVVIPGKPYDPRQQADPPGKIVGAGGGGGPGGERDTEEGGVYAGDGGVQPVWDQTAIRTNGEYEQKGARDELISPHKWRMYYYGRDSDTWAKGVKAIPAPFGRIGLALSDDGIFWERYRGPLPGGAIFDPSDAEDAFDCVQVSVGDVIPPPADVSSATAGWAGAMGGSNAGGGAQLWRMYYIASGLKRPRAPAPVAGFKVGMATSEEGVNWTRMDQPVLKEGLHGEIDEAFASFPRVMEPHPMGPKVWYMTYHTGRDETLDVGPFHRLITCWATSEDGVAWEKQGPVLYGGGPGAWDEGGVGMRHVIIDEGRYYMLYTGLSTKLVFGIGLAISEDGLIWEKAKIRGKEPGGPVFTPRTGEHAWDNLAVGAPFLLKRGNDIWMYYMGASRGLDGSLVTGMGLAVCKSRDFLTWERHAGTKAFA